jgi:hypothetical protein
MTHRTPKEDSMPARSFRVTIKNRRALETVRRIYQAADAADAKRQALASHPYRYGWRVTDVEAWA